jgi:hypothetical protein
MGQTSATNSADVAPEVPDSHIWSPSHDGAESVRTVAAEAGLPRRDYVQLSSNTPTRSRARIAGIDRPSTLDALLALPPWLSELAQNHVDTVADFARALQPSLALGLALGQFRALLSQSWSADTAYPGTVATSDWVAGNPRGQCGVSSVWLSDILNREYSIRSILCRGSVKFLDQQAENIPDHCWLEIAGPSGEDLILDLTCDQAEGFDRQIVFNSRARLDMEHIRYQSHDRINISDLPGDPFFWPRYLRLLRNMVTFADRCPWLPLITILRESAGKSHGTGTPRLQLAQHFVADPSKAPQPLD